MKIICIDNFNRDYISDTLVAENVPPFYAKLILDFLIEKHTSGNGQHYFKIEDDDYELYTFEP